MIERDRTLAVICGASSWPRYGYEPAAAFAKSAEEIRKYLCSEPGLGIPADNLAWLFDTPDAVAQYDQIDSFLARRLGALNAPQGKGVSVIFCYVGQRRVARPGARVLSVGYRHPAAYRGCY